jgi:NAD(P)-dependent dehydrogenase (short-subunit alcohol dehydrogenase family)
MSEKINNLFDLKGRVAIVTGAARGIGKEIASAFAGAGARVVIADIAYEAAGAVAKTLQDRGFDALALGVDVSCEDDVKSMAKDTLSNFGTIDVLVNNAARGGGPASVELLSLEDWNSVIMVNLTSVFLCCREVGKIMIEKKQGSIINMSSVEAMVARAYKDEAAYGVTKAGILELTRELAKSWAKFNIRVNALAPGYTNTDFANLGADPTKLGMIKERSPMKRPAEPTELCGPAIFLASNASSYVTGHTLVVDGGWTIV